MNILDVKKRLAEKIEQFFKEKYGSTVAVDLQLPELVHGDLTTNICLQEGKKLGKNPVELAVELKNFLDLGNREMSDPGQGKSNTLDLDRSSGSFANSKKTFFEKIEVKGPGFLNFYFSSQTLRGLQNKKTFFDNFVNFFWPKNNFRNKKYFGQKILVEHTSVNLFKPFTIGHLMSNFIGEFVRRIFLEFGAEVVNISYPSDISIGIAKAIYIIKKDGGLSQAIFKKSEKEMVSYLGECYRNGVNLYKQAEEENNLKLVREVKDIANNLYGNIPSEDLDIFNFTKKINLNYFSNVLKKLDSSFDQLIFESEAGVVGKKMVLENVESNGLGQGKSNTLDLDHPTSGVGNVSGSQPSIFKKSEGAIIYEPTEVRKDINTSVFINSEGNPTYLAKDLGLIKIKRDKFNFDKNFVVVDNEQIPHFKTVFAVSDEIFPELTNKNVHISHGRMTFKGQKMSSRLGGVPSGEEVIDTILDAVNEKSDDRNIDEKTKLDVALSALRISILRSKLGVNIDFDPERALSFEGDSGPYLCYTSARLHSLLQKGKEAGLFPGLKISHVGTEKDLERKIFQFENILENVVDEIAPQKLVTYLFELCGLFNSFYNETKIISGDKFLSEHYLKIVSKTLAVLTCGLDILGIKAPEKM